MEIYVFVASEQRMAEIPRWLPISSMANPLSTCIAAGGVRKTNGSHAEKFCQTNETIAES